MQEARAPSQALYGQSHNCFRRANEAYKACNYQLSDELMAQVCVRKSAGMACYVKENFVS